MESNEVIFDETKHEMVEDGGYVLKEAAENYRQNTIEAAHRNRIRSLLAKFFGFGKLAPLDIAHEEALREDNNRRAEELRQEQLRQEALLEQEFLSRCNDTFIDSALSSIRAFVIKGRKARLVAFGMPSEDQFEQSFNRYLQEKKEAHDKLIKVEIPEKETEVADLSRKIDDGTFIDADINRARMKIEELEAILLKLRAEQLELGKFLSADVKKQQDSFKRFAEQQAYQAYIKFYPGRSRFDAELPQERPEYYLSDDDVRTYQGLFDTLLSLLKRATAAINGDSNTGVIETKMFSAKGLKDSVGKLVDDDTCLYVQVYKNGHGHESVGLGRSYTPTDERSYGTSFDFRPADQFVRIKFKDEETAAAYYHLFLRADEIAARLPRIVSKDKTVGCRCCDFWEWRADVYRSRSDIPLTK